MRGVAGSGVCGSLLKFEIRKIDIHKVWQKIGESGDIFPSLVGGVLLYPFKLLKSTGERGEDRCENVEGH